VNALLAAEVERLTEVCAATLSASFEMLCIPIADEENRETAAEWAANWAMSWNAWAVMADTTQPTVETETGAD